MDNTEKLATYGTQDTGQIKVRECRRSNQKWTIQRNWQHRVHRRGKTKQKQSRETGNIGTHDEEKQNKNTIFSFSGALDLEEKNNMLL